MQNTTDSVADVDPISPAAVEYDDAESSERTHLFLCAGVFILVVLSCAWYARRVKRNSPIPVPAGATALTRLEDLSTTTLLPPAILHHVSGFQYGRFAGQLVCEVKLALDHEIVLIRPLQGPELATGPDKTAMTSNDDESNLEGKTICFVCMERPADAILLECGHSGLCVECATMLWDQARRCPLCRRGFAAVMRIVARETCSVSALRARAIGARLLIAHWNRRRGWSRCTTFCASRGPKRELRSASTTSRALPRWRAQSSFSPPIKALNEHAMEGLRMIGGERLR